MYNKCDKPNTLSFDPDILLTSAKTGYGLDKLLQKLDEVLSDRVHYHPVLPFYDKLACCPHAGARQRTDGGNTGSDGLYLANRQDRGIWYCFEGYLV